MATPLDWGNNMFDGRMVINIKTAEGLRLKAYKDSLGFWTAGYGHKLPDANDGDHEWEGFVCTQAQADQWFMEDLKAAKDEVLKLGLVGVTGVRIQAIIELMFNMGPNKLKKFIKMWGCISAGDWAGAKRELLDSLWAKQVGEARSTRIADMLETGAYSG